MPSQDGGVSSVLGVDACKVGWVGVVLSDGHFAGASVAATFDSLVTAVTAVTAVHGDLEVIGVDMATAISDATVRQADVLARARVGRLASSVFVIPVRPAVLAPTFAEAVDIQRRLTGRGISIQAYGLRAKLLEVDVWQRGTVGPPVVEVHPEVVFARLAGEPLTLNKRTWGGMVRRRRLLAEAGIEVPDALGPVDRVGIDDVLDAAAVAWTANRVAAGEAECLPDPPERFSDGRPAAVWV